MSSDKDESMNEVLASIKRIMTENPGNKGAVLDLTEMVSEDGTIVQLNPASSEKPAEEQPARVLSKSEELLKLIEENDKNLQFPHESELASGMDQEVGDDNMLKARIDESDREALISNQTIAASVSALKKLEEAKSTSNYQSQSRSLDDLVKEAILPLLHSWIDQNLQSIVEKVVEREIQRLTNRLD